ncbi:hypothetical protein [Methanoculleus chikugoensis]|uniref:hypothetical protein n=1 Tax=Methanoculleus chikugoensis TaxID=118126 RepID=UPI001FB1B6BA|nr:hypothetical protein [Methanoculleus chikugoensis]
MQEVRDKVEPSLRRADVDMELCSSQRDDRLDLIETLGQRQCSAPGSGREFPGASKSQDLLATTGMYPVHTGTAVRSVEAHGDECLCAFTFRCSINCFPNATATWRGVRYPAPPSGFARGFTVPARPVRGGPAHASHCGDPAVDAARYNA